MTIGADGTARDHSFDFVCAVEAVSLPLRRYARRLTQDDAACDDLVQDTLLRAWAARDRFTIGTNFKAWLFRIARNRFLSDRRRFKRQVYLEADEISRLFPVPATQEEGVYLRDLDRALESLPPKQATALRITQDGMDPQLAARRIGVPIGTLRSRTSRARKALVTFFEQPVNVDAGPVAPDPDESAKSHVLCDTGNRGIYRAWKASGRSTIG